MPSYLHPGVYIEEVPSGSRPIEAAGTSTALFIGYADRGPLAEPELISSWSRYEELFGGLLDPDDPDVDFDAHAMGHGVYAFFQNGGAKAYIVRLAGGSPAASSGAIPAAGDATDQIGFTAANPGTWGDALVVRLTSKAPADPANDAFLLEIGSGTGDDFEAVEVFPNVTLTAGDPEYIVDLVNDSSPRVEVSVDDTFDPAASRSALNAASTPTTPGDPAVPVELQLANGDDGGEPGADEYDPVFTALLKVRDINMVLLPGLAWDGGDQQAIIESAVSHCERMKNRMVLVDLPAGAELENENDVQGLNLTTSTYAATYYPWPLVANRFYDPDLNPGGSRTVAVSPAAFAAGMWARTDERRGVWKAPAGVESQLTGVSRLEFVVENAEQDYLNPHGINALRRLPNYGNVIWGARTRSTRANPEWRYVPVRRTAMFIEESVYNGIQWAVFEPNDHRLWSALRANIESFMNGLFRVGAFQGEKASDAYFVRCGLGQTMTQGDIDRGQVIVQVGFAPLKPAEFVIVRIMQKVQQQ